MEELKSSKADSAQGYASGYQLSFYGAQEVTDALVIRPTPAAER